MLVASTFKNDARIYENCQRIFTVPGKFETIMTFVRHKRQRYRYLQHIQA